MVRPSRDRCDRGPSKYLTARLVPTGFGGDARLDFGGRKPVSSPAPMRWLPRNGLSRASLALALLGAPVIGCGGGSDKSDNVGGGGAGQTTSPATDTTASSSTESSAGGGGAGGSGGTKLVSVFVAQGHMGRTTVSCDGGQSWIENHSLDDGVRCFEPLDCDHTAGAGRGLAFGNGLWVAAFGWGEPGTVKTSRDGATWETVIDPAPSIADVAFGQDVFIANSIPPQISADGKTWAVSPATDGLQLYNPRAIGFSPDFGGTFTITGESGSTLDIVTSHDGGKSFTHPDARPPECLKFARGIAGGNGAIVGVSGEGFVCTSTDGGKAWTHVPITDGFSSPPIFTGTEFMVWNRATLHRSSDGLTWSAEPVSPASVSIGAVARSPEGVLVASNDGWLAWYEKQHFYRSTDGVTWEVLDASKFVGSHPIQLIEHGLVEPNAICP